MYEDKDDGEVTELEEGEVTPFSFSLSTSLDFLFSVVLSSSRSFEVLKTSRSREAFSKFKGKGILAGGVGMGFGSG